MINELAKQIHKNNIQKGFFEDVKNIGEMLCLIHSEVSEALECDRKDKYYEEPIIKGGLKINEAISEQSDSWYKNYFEASVKDTFEDELADIMIRVMDLAAFKNVDLETHIKAKMRYNSLREYKHGKKY
jgi:NTP pyrophosphatase (non-canonical NTP hydrolase)